MTMVTRTSLELRVNATTQFKQDNSAVVGLSDGGYVVVWETGSAFFEYLKGQRFDADGNSVGDFYINQSQDSPLVRPGMTPAISAASDGGYIVSWAGTSGFSSDIDVRRYAGDNTPSDQVVVTSNSSDATDTGRVIETPSTVVGLTGGSYVVGWIQKDGDGYERIHRQVFNQDGGRVGNEQEIVRTGGTSQTALHFEGIDTGGFVQVWAESSGIYVQRFGIFFNPLGSVQQVNTLNNFTQQNPDVASLGDNGFIVTWEAANSGGVGYDVQAQRFNLDGVRVGTEFTVNTTLAGDQYHSQVTGLTDGGFVVTWLASDGGGVGIYAQRYDVNAVKVGGEILVNSTTTGDQVGQSVSALTNGGFVVTWTAADGNDTGIFSKTFQAPATFAGATTTAAEIIQGDGTAETINVAPNTLGAGDQLYGGGGVDTLRMTAPGTFDLAAVTAITGFEKLVGSSGTDTFIVSAANLAGFTSIDGGGGVDTFVSADTISLAANNITNATLTGAAAVNATGNALNNTLTGNSAANVLDGGAGNDTLQGGLGADNMKGGIGNDTYYVDDAGDKVIEAANAGTDSVHATVASYTLTANAERLYFDDTGNHTAKGNALGNLIYGNAGLDKFLIDAGGNDTFSGGGGEDTFDGRTATTGMVLRLDAQANNAGSVAGDTFASIEKFFGSNTAADQMTTGAARAKFFGYGGNDTLTGGSSIDALSGGAGNDSLVGNGGQDALDGGIGNDTMTGGAGADTFTFVDAAFGKDVITDFEDGLDKLKVYSAIANSFDDFTVTGNGTHHVVLTLNAATANTITLDNASHNITVSAADFLFY